MEKFQGILENVYELIITYGMKFVTAIVVLIVGLIVIKLPCNEEGKCE